jgi:hypothetical protein
MGPPPGADPMPGRSGRGGGSGGISGGSGGMGGGSGDPSGGSGARAGGSGDPSGGSGARAGGSGIRPRDLGGMEPSAFADRPDLLQQAVKALKGKTFVVHEAGEFARAIEQIRALAPKPKLAKP